MIQMICCKCYKPVKIGEDAIYDDEESLVCDSCAGVERDLEGYAWLPGEEVHYYQDVETGEESWVSRGEAFGEAQKEDQDADAG